MRSVISKSGSGTLILSASNTYTGATTIADGKIRLNGGVPAMDGVSVEGVPMLNNTGFTQRMQKFLGHQVSLELINLIAAEDDRGYDGTRPDPLRAASFRT